MQWAPDVNPVAMIDFHFCHWLYVFMCFICGITFIWIVDPQHMRYGCVFTVDSRYNKLLGAQWNYFVISKFCYIQIAKTTKYKDILNFGTKKITLLYQEFVISVFFITRVHCIAFNVPSSRMFCEGIGFRIVGNVWSKASFWLLQSQLPQIEAILL